MADPSPLPTTFKIEQEAPVAHWWQARRPRPAELTITPGRVDYSFPDGERRSVSLTDPGTRFLFRNWSGAVPNKYAGADVGVITLETKNYPFEVLIRPGKDRFTLPQDVWDALRSACEAAKLPLLRLGPDPSIPDGVESYLYSLKPLGFWGEW